jgi:hypothetical protein
MKRYWSVLLFPIAVLYGLQLHGQSVGDTLSKVQGLKASGRYGEAEALLQSWTLAHPRSADVVWLEAQLAWGRLQFSRSDRLYREAITADPDNLYLRLDHAESLLNAGRFAAARRSLAGLSREQRRDPHALYLQAKYAYWTGSYLEAGELVGRALRADRGKADALALDGEIRTASALWLDLSTMRTDDDQPLRKLEPRLEAGKYLHALADVRFEARGAFFDSGEGRPQAWQAVISNTMHFARTGTALRFGAGLFALPGQGEGPTGGIELRQRLPEGISLTTGWQREAYTRNVTSLDTLVFEHATRLVLDWKERHGVWLQGGGLHSTFGDDNRVVTYWAWALSPSLGGDRWKFRSGYGFHYADSRENRFISDRPLEDWLNPYDPAAEIRGVFAPYFTPQHMRTHQWLASFSWSASDRISLYLNGSYGLWARARNPYLFLDQDGGELFIRRAFLDTRFQPFEVGGTLLFAFSARARLKAVYQFTRNFFYENQTFILAFHLLPGYKT